LTHTFSSSQATFAALIFCGGMGVAVGVGVFEGVRVAVAVAVAVGVLDGLGVKVAVAVGVSVGSGVSVQLAAVTVARASAMRRS
jgi:hypothetical protein